MLRLRYSVHLPYGPHETTEVYGAWHPRCPLVREVMEAIAAHRNLHWPDSGCVVEEMEAEP